MYADQTKALSTPESMCRRNSAKMRSVTWSVKLSSTSAWRLHSFHAFVTNSTPPAIDQFLYLLLASDTNKLGQVKVLLRRHLFPFMSQLYLYILLYYICTTMRTSIRIRGAPSRKHIRCKSPLPLSHAPPWMSIVLPLLIVSKFALHLICSHLYMKY